MDARVAGQLRVERGYEKPALPEQHRRAVVARQNLHLRACVGDPGGADEHTPKRLGLARKREVGLEARDLAAVAVPLDVDVDETEMRAVEQDHSGAGPRRPAPRSCGSPPRARTAASGA